MTRHGTVVGIAGWSGSGKTSLIVRLIPALVAKRYRVATVKHAHHEFDIDIPGKDSYEHRAAGAVEVVVSSARRWAVVHENRGEPEPALGDILHRLSPADIILVEGYKDEPHEKIEVWRGNADRRPLYEDNPSIVAVATDDPAGIRSIPTLDINDAAGVASFIIERYGLAMAVEKAG